MVDSNADITDLDWMVDMGKAGDQFSDQVSLNGNFDPVTVMLQGTPDDVYQGTIKSLREGGFNSFSTAGCEIPDLTPVENLHAQTRALHDYSE